jgi:prepilin-type processing-associated H-X9-DG protein
VSLRARALILAAVATAAVAAHQRRPGAAPVGAEAPPPPPEVPEAPTWTPDLRAPQPAEVVAAIDRAFRGALPPEALAVHRTVSGDFNGDRSPDLAVPARALAEKVPEISSSLANWILQDPRSPLPPPVPDPPIAPVVVGKDDMLLAIVHGVDGEGWRSPEARQCYLLTIAFDGAIEIETRESVLARAAKGKARLPRLRGDLIRHGGRGAFLYWDGARYAWHAASAR